MPIYLYQCQDCGEKYEKILKMNQGNIEDSTLYTECPKCEGEGVKQLVTCHFKINGYSESNGYSKQS